MSILTIVTLCFSYTVVALLAQGWMGVGLAAAGGILFVTFLNLFPWYTRFAFKVILPNLAVLWLLNLAAAMLAAGGFNAVAAGQIAVATILCLKLFVFATAMYTTVLAGQRRSFALELESRGLPVLFSYVLGMSLRAPGLLIGEIHNVINGFRGRGMTAPPSLVGRVKVLLVTAASFLRISLFHSENRALALYNKNYFGDSKTRATKFSERLWEPVLRYSSLSVAAYLVMRRFL